MKELISQQQFLLRQPSFPKKSNTDSYYFDLANRLANIIANENLLPGWQESLKNRVALGLTGYLQDILTDSGIWRSFIVRNNDLYGKWLPFYDIPEDYIPHELNETDVRFLIWYTLTMNSEEELRLTDPENPDIERTAKRLHQELDNVYEDEDAPMPEDYFIWRGLELNNPAETDDVFHFGHWLFMHCYLMTPAYAMTLAELMMNPDLKNGENMELLQKTLEESMMEDPTGPLALYLKEWLFLILEGKMPPEPSKTAQEASEHPYYTRFMEATDGQPIQFFATYGELNDFFIHALGWGEGEHLAALKERKDFVLLVNREKGMLCAADVAGCIDLPGNPCYNKEYAATHAIDLLTMRGRCPADLLHYIFKHDALPDAVFPGSSNHRLVKENRDFIARCYLQKYYRGD